jgi:glycosyltransferase involved in cell wall biosynthesis
MWSKCACIGTATGSMPEFIEEGVTGHLVEPGDSAALADRLKALLGDPEKTRSMGERGFAAARQYWSWAAVVARMLGEIRGQPGRSGVVPAQDQGRINAAAPASSDAAVSSRDGRRHAS